MCPRESRNWIGLFLPEEESYLPFQKHLGAFATHFVWFEHVHEMLRPQKDFNLAPLVLIIDLDLLQNNPLQSVKDRFPDTICIGVSSTDCPRLAVDCIESGFSDFLIKPLSPRSVSYSLKKNTQKKRILSKLTQGQLPLLEVISQISQSQSTSFSQISAMKFIQQRLNAREVLWFKAEVVGEIAPQGISSYPQKLEAQAEGDFLLAQTLLQESLAPSNPCAHHRRLHHVIKIENTENEYVVALDTALPTQPEHLIEVELVLEHVTNTTDQLKKISKLEQESFLDELTGLFNSRYLKHMLSNMILKSKRKSTLFSILFIDVDHFKLVNDHHGHLTGSDFLVAIGKTVKNTVRENDSVFRYGGDEFVVVLDETPRSESLVIAERIRKNIEKRVFKIKNIPLQTTVSIGIANYPLDGKNELDLLKLADQAMYGAKKHQRNCVHSVDGLVGDLTPPPPPLAPKLAET